MRDKVIQYSQRHFSLKSLFQNKVISLHAGADDTHTR